MEDRRIPAGPGALTAQGPQLRLALLRLRSWSFCDRTQGCLYPGTCRPRTGRKEHPLHSHLPQTGPDVILSISLLSSALGSNQADDRSSAHSSTPLDSLAVGRELSRRGLLEISSVLNSYIVRHSASQIHLDLNSVLKRFRSRSK